MARRRIGDAPPVDATRRDAAARFPRILPFGPRTPMEIHLLRAALWRKRGTVALAVLAVAIGASVASALLHVSGDVSRKLSTELRALGPNLLLVPDASGPAPQAWLSEREARARLAAAHLDGVPVLYVVATVRGEPVQIVGADLDAARRLHPSWRVRSGASGAPLGFVGTRLLRRLGVHPGESLTLVLAQDPGRMRAYPVGAEIEAGGADDESWWMPLGEAQALAALPDRVSLVQARIPAGEDPARAVHQLERGGGMRALVLHALSATEAGLLERMRRLMALVTAAALVAAGLCAFGTLTDLALERRREIALMKALGAAPGEIVRQFAAESLAIGLVGGVLGWAIGLFFAEVIGREVFRSIIAVRWNVPPVVIALSLLVAVIAGLGPIRLALAVQPATALKGD